MVTLVCQLSDDSASAGTLFYLLTVDYRLYPAIKLAKDDWFGSLK